MALQLFSITADQSGRNKEDGLMNTMQQPNSVGIGIDWSIDRRRSKNYSNVLAFVGSMQRIGSIVGAIDYSKKYNLSHEEKNLLFNFIGQLLDINFVGMEDDCIARCRDTYRKGIIATNNYLCNDDLTKSERLGLKMILMQYDGRKFAKLSPRLTYGTARTLANELGFSEVTVYNVLCSVSQYKVFFVRSYGFDIDIMKKSSRTHKVFGLYPVNLLAGEFGKFRSFEELHSVKTF